MSNELKGVGVRFGIVAHSAHCGVHEGIVAVVPSIAAA